MDTTGKTCSCFNHFAGVPGEEESPPEVIGIIASGRVTNNNVYIPWGYDTSATTPSTPGINEEFLVPHNGTIVAGLEKQCTTPQNGTITVYVNGIASTQSFALTNASPIEVGLVSTSIASLSAGDLLSLRWVGGNMGETKLGIALLLPF